MVNATKRRPLSKRVQYRIEWVLMHLLIVLCSIFPLRVLRRVGRSLGWVAWRVFRVRKRVVVDNISRSFPGAPSGGVDAIALESCEQYGMALMEFARFRRLSRRELMGMVDVEGIEHLDAALSHGKGAVLFSGHFGNWELLGALLARRGYPLHVTDTNHSNELTHRIISGLRFGQGMKVIAPSEPSSRITGLLSENKFVSYLADQDARRDGIFVDFLGSGDLLDPQTVSDRRPFSPPPGPRPPPRRDRGTDLAGSAPQRARSDPRPHAALHENSGETHPREAGAVLLDAPALENPAVRRARAVNERRSTSVSLRCPSPSGNRWVAGWGRWERRGSCRGPSRTWRCWFRAW